MTYIHVLAPETTDRAVRATTCLDCGRGVRAHKIANAKTRWRALAAVEKHLNYGEADEAISSRSRRPDR